MDTTSMTKPHQTTTELGRETRYFFNMDLFHIIGVNQVTLFIKNGAEISGAVGFYFGPMGRELLGKTGRRPSTFSTALA